MRNSKNESTPPHEKRFRILSFDGGPSTLTMLHILLLVARKEPEVLKNVDMFAGSSSGSFAALYLAKKMSKEGVDSESAIEECIRFMEQIVGCFKLTVGGTAKFLSGFFPLFDGGALYSALDTAFEETKLGELEDAGKFVSVQFFNATKGKTSTYATSLSSRDTKLSDIARASSAFHPLMPIFQAPSEDAAGEGDLLFDGIFSTNAPILSAIQDAVLVLRRKQASEGNAAASCSSTDSTLGRLSMLSMGFNIDIPLSMKKIYSRLWSQYIDSSSFLPLRVVSFLSRLCAENGPRTLDRGWLWSLWNAFWGGAEKLLGTPPQDEAVFADLLLGSEGFHRCAPSYASRSNVLSIMWSWQGSIAEARTLARWFWAGSLEEAVTQFGSNNVETSGVIEVLAVVGIAAYMVVMPYLDDRELVSTTSKKNLMDWLDKNGWFETHA